MMHGGNVWQGDRPSRWLDYSANIRPEGAPEWVRQALLAAMDDISYYPDPGMARAKAALSEYLGLPGECVLPTAGGISAIDLAVRLNASDMIICTPCFGEYAQQAAVHGRTVRRVSLLESRHVIGEPAALVGAELREGSAVWLCNPLNPVGCAFARAQIGALLERVNAVHGWLIVDEAFIEYCPEHSVRSWIGKQPRLLITGSMTKILGIPGVRLGYMCAQADVLAQLSRYQLTWELNCFAERVLCALPEHAAELDADVRRNAVRRERLRAALEELGAFVYPSEASFLLADFGRPVKPIADALRPHDILVRSCMNFDGIDDGCHLRLAVKDEASNLRLVDALREAIICAENR